jgi:predicted RNA-binding protein Jag
MVFIEVIIIPVQIRFAYNVYIGGEIKIINVGRTIQDIITNNPEVLDIRSNKHLKIVGEMKSGFPSFDKSHIEDHNWAPPVSDMDSKEEWYSYIKTNQPDFDNHIESNNIFVHKQKLVEFLGRDMLGHLMADDRQKKLDNLGI